MSNNNKRICYIDNLRWMTVSLLIIYHAAIAYNTWGEANYIFFESTKPIAALVTFVSLWFMPLMFLLAGASSRWSLRKRGCRVFIKERFKRLGIPLVFGILVIDPVLSFIADVTHNGYAEGYFAHYGVFFTRFTDLTGYDGGFTLGHFWFLAVLLIVSLLSLIIIKAVGDVPAGSKKAVILGTVLAAAAAAALDVRPFGKQIPTYLCVYLLGYYFFSDPRLAERLSRHRRILTALFLLFSAANTVLFIFIDGFDTLNTVCWYAASVTSLPALFAIGHDRLDFSNAFTRSASGISYIFYIIHFPAVILCQYLLDRAGMGHTANFFLTLLITYPVTAGLCHAVDRTRYLRLLFGSGKKQYTSRQEDKRKERN